MQQNNQSSKKSKYIKRPTLKSKLFAYLCALCIFTISVLWVFQVFLLDEFYYQVTLVSLRDSAQSYSSLDDGQITERVSYLHSATNVSAIVCNSNGEVIAASDEHPDALIRHLGTDMRKKLYTEAKENGGEYVQTFDFSDVAIERPGNSERIPADTNEQLPVMPKDEQPKEEQQSNVRSVNIGGVRLIYSKIVTNDKGADRLILLDCSLSPVDTVIDTIKIQLLIVSVLCIIISVCIALLFSYRISRPISRINENAKQLSKGKYEVSFHGGGCREIDELSYTLEHTARELSKLEVMQNELISNISHDLRTPLTMIGGYAEVMRDIPDETTPENIQIIIDETKRLTSLVNNLLEVSRLSSEAKKLEPEAFSLTELIRETVDRFDKLNESKGYTITFESKEDVRVLADREKISQVLYNLIGNAVNYTGIDKRVHIIQTYANSIVKIEICDTGEGITPEELPNIWERYYRIDKYHRRSEVGMGIGLSIVKDILEAHNAAFGVSSKLGAGSVFWFKLHTL